jgi:ATP-dependent helicase/nuclease subunit A
MRETGTYRAALDPRANVVVEACAGSGKTWLLVSRMVRLLLAGARPSEILAITFTRKAAQEMEARLRQWLRVLALEPDAQVREFLLQREVPEEEAGALLAPARHLLERYLAADPPITISTFHSWFLELLQRAPLDAGAVGRVTLLEQTSALLEEAWGEFAQSLGRDPQSELARHFQALLRRLGLHNTRVLLFALVRDRIRWWAYTAGERRPVQWALGALQAQLGVDPAADPARELMEGTEFRLSLERLRAALAAGSAGEREYAGRIEAALGAADPGAALDLVSGVLLTNKGEPRRAVADAATRAGLGAAHAAAIAALQRAQVALVELATLRLHESALPCGEALIAAYQGLKELRESMDFTDVEWRAWQLLARSDHAEYMQYKLDARYRHILVDEFQDTNPAQWQILRAWLAASAEAGCAPSVFLVGDPKQSIYRFRGAEARLFRVGRDFLAEVCGGRHLSIPVTRRCAPAVVAAVNAVFAGEPRFAGFERHEAHDQDLPGRVWVLPLARAGAAPGPAPAGGFRNPLVAARPEAPEAARAEEARQLVAGIREIAGRWVIRDRQRRANRVAGYGDILVLVRRRTQLHAYERALREAGIPYLTSRQGGLLDTLEASDLVALLEFLITPFADLQLAQALRSPLFSASDDDLAALAARGEGGWWRRLEGLAAAGGASPALARARRLLAGWLRVVDRLPVHDLLDRIYFEADLERRYREAAPAVMREAVAANLDAFMALALEVDAGRYPSLPRFLNELRRLQRAAAEEAPDEGVVGEAGRAVRILTVHGAKGLEAPVVWLLDAHAPVHGADTYRVLVDWPPEAPRPTHFSLVTVAGERGRARDAVFRQDEDLQAREELNLLYVAMTRAEQALVVSGCDNSKAGDASWYLRVARALGGEESGAVLGDDLAAFEAPAPATEAAPTPPPVDSRLTKPLPTGERRAAFSSPETRRGELLHRLLQHMAPPAAVTDAAWLREMTGLDESEFGELAAEARAILEAPALARFFDPAQYVRARNEVAYVDAAGETCYIDRLVEFAGEVWVLDYKTGEAADPASARRRYRAQLEDYRGAMCSLFPSKPVRAAVVLRGGAMAELD